MALIINEPPLPVRPFRKSSEKLAKPNYEVPTAKQIFDDVILSFGITQEDMISSCRTEDIAKLRRLYCYLANVLTIEKPSQIAALMQRDRSTYYTHVERFVDLFRIQDSELMDTWYAYLKNSKMWHRYFKIKKDATRWKKNPQTHYR